MLAHYAGGSPVVIQTLLQNLWILNSTTLFVQIHGSITPAELVLAHQAGHRVIATGQNFRAETSTYEPAPDGAYLVERQYRQLGFYEAPPSEQAVVVLRIAAGSGRTYLVDVPDYVSHATVVVNQRTLAEATLIPQRAELRYSVGSG
jgi:hypothetical protein